MKKVEIKGSLFFTIIALVVVMYGALSMRIMNSSFSAVEAEGIEIRIPKRPLHFRVHCSITHNSQGMKQTKCPLTDK